MRIVSTLAVSTAVFLVASAPEATAQEGYIGELREFPYNFCPRGWTEAAGQMLPISQNTALFSLLGTNFGGDGRTTFGLPDLRETVSPPPSPTPVAPTGPAGVTVYQHCDFAGWIAQFEAGEYTGRDGFPDAWVGNDASSVKVSAGFEVDVYQLSDFEGRVVTYTADDACFVDENMNDEASSIRVRQVSMPPVTPAPQPTRQTGLVRTCIAVQGVFPSRN